MRAPVRQFFIARRMHSMTGTESGDIYPTQGLPPAQSQDTNPVPRLSTDKAPPPTRQPKSLNYLLALRATRNLASEKYQPDGLAPDSVRGSQRASRQIAGSLKHARTRKRQPRLLRPTIAVKTNIHSHQPQESTFLT